MKRIALALALVLAMLAAPQVMHAQTGARLTLRSVETENFPTIGGYVEARDASGDFISGLEAEDFVALEDGNPRPMMRVREAESDWRVAVALNPAEPFAIRDAEGVNRYTHVLEMLQAWADTHSGSDRASFGLSSPEGVVTNFVDAESWLAELDGYVPDLGRLFPDLVALATALQLSEQPDEAGSTASAIWLITSMPDDASLANLENLQETALAQNVPVYVWLVDANSRFDSEGAAALQGLAEATGGSYFAYSGEEELPNPTSYFASLGRAYFFQFSSEIQEAGEHEVALQLEYEEQTLTSRALTYSLNIEPPNPIFVSPPTDIQRAPSESDAEVLSPFSQAIEIVVEFPDDFERPLVRSTLFVNDQQVAENRSEPFTRFTWNLAEYESSTRVFIRVEAEDELGLVGSSLEFPVEISVVAAPGGLRGLLARNIPLITLIAAIVAAGAIFVVFVMSGRIAPPPVLRREPRHPRPIESDPLLDTPPSIADMARPRAEEDAPAKSRAERVAKAPRLAPVYLQPIDAQGSEHAAPIFMFDGYELLIGADEATCRLHVEDSSVEGQHSVLRRLEDGGFELADLGTEAGTWLNYAPVTTEGARVQAGDLIHVGRVAFRFHLEQPAEGRLGENS